MATGILSDGTICGVVAVLGPRLGSLPILPMTNNEGGYLPATAGAEEWGALNGIGSRAGKDRFHDLKKDIKGPRAADDYKVNQQTGDVIDSNGEVVGNFNEVPPGKQEKKGNSNR